jgi:hypothetical protein
MNATYRKPILADYEGNPLIEALPPFLEPVELYNKLFSPIKYNNDERYLSKSQRILMLNRLKELFIPSFLHVKLYNNIYMAILEGYKKRNPLNPENVRRRCNIRRKYFNMNIDISNFYKIYDMDDDDLTTTDGLCIFGISGSGKTISTNKILRLFPQYILHTEYNNHRFVENQVVYIKLECPTDGSIKTLCNAFFSKLDEIIDDAQYFKNWGGERRGTMVQNMPNAAINENIGLIIIDEIQHLVKTQNKTKELLDFLVEIINTIKVPIMVIGTNKACKILQDNIRGPRRIGGFAYMSWDRIEEPKEWKTFMTALWQYQWTKEEAPLTDKMIELFYLHTQGILDFAVKLFIFSQANAIYSGHEKIDASTVNETEKNDLALTKEMREAIRSGNVEAMAQYEDILLPKDYEKLKNLAKKVESEDRIQQTAAINKMIVENQKEDIYLTLFNKMQAFANGETEVLKKTLNELVKNIDHAKTFNEIEQDAQKLFMHNYREKIIEVASSGKKQRKSKPVSYAKSDLRSCTEKAKSGNKDAYMVLYEIGYIKSPSEFVH